MDLDLTDAEPGPPGLVASPTQELAWDVLRCTDQVLAAALWDERFDPGVTSFAVTDLDVNPTDLDASYFTAYIHCGGGTWDEQSDPEKRREFWEWWLTHAVPTAFHSPDR
jgi:hypothetical protein